MAQAKNGHKPSIFSPNDPAGASADPLFTLPTAVPQAAVASPGIAPLDLAALGEFVFTTPGQNPLDPAGTLVVKSSADFVGGDIAYVNVTQNANGAYVVSSGALPASASHQHGTNPGATGATYDLVESSSGLKLDFQPDRSNPGHYQFSVLNSINKVSASLTTAQVGGSFGDVTVLGWNANSILLSTTSAGDAFLPNNTTTPEHIVISTSDMTVRSSSLPTSTTFTTTGKAPVIFGHTIKEVPCFAAGTKLATPEGACAVEMLKAGDLVLTQDGRALPIEWVGSRAVDCSRHPRPERVWPVRVLRGAFGPFMPGRDLLLSPDHSVFVGGVLIPVCELIDGRLIRQEQVKTIRYLHVQLALHEILLAEGMPVESLLDPLSRGQFDDAPAGGELHPDFAATALAWEASCVPIRLWGPEVESARAFLAERASALREAV
jgi:hypothetical protein